jgi:hypothetical protein
MSWISICLFARLKGGRERGKYLGRKSWFNATYPFQACHLFHHDVSKQSPFYMQLGTSVLHVGERERLLTHIAAKLGHVILSSLVLLILVNPLVEVGLKEVELLGVLEQPRPELFLELLLLQLQLDMLRSVVNMALGGVDLAKQLKLDMVSVLEAGRFSSEGHAGGLQVQLLVLFGDVGNGNSKVDEVLGSIGHRRALGPENCSLETTQSARVPTIAIKSVALAIKANGGGVEATRLLQKRKAVMERESCVP